MVCKNCGDKQLLAKYYPSMGHGMWSVEAFAVWVEKHMECSPYFGLFDLKGDNCFEVRSESSGFFGLSEAEKEELNRQRLEREANHE
jgi:hypothetical protein